VLDLEQELDGVLRALEQHDIAYAICGGIAMAIHGHPRATIDIDLLIRPEDEEPVYAAVAPLGFQIRAQPMEFDGGQTQIRRVTKIDPADGETLMLDLLLVTPKHEPVWQSRDVAVARTQRFRRVRRRPDCAKVIARQQAGPRRHRATE
jgi:hypothetical protein